MRSAIFFCLSVWIHNATLAVSTGNDRGSESSQLHMAKDGLLKQKQGTPLSPIGNDHVGRRLGFQPSTSCSTTDETNRKRCVDVEDASPTDCTTWLNLYECIRRSCATGVCHCSEDDDLLGRVVEEAAGHKVHLTVVNSSSVECQYPDPVAARDETSSPDAMLSSKGTLHLEIINKYAHPPKFRNLEKYDVEEINKRCTMTRDDFKQGPWCSKSSTPPTEMPGSSSCQTVFLGGVARIQCGLEHCCSALNGYDQGYDFSVWSQVFDCSFPDVDKFQKCDNSTKHRDLLRPGCCNACEDLKKNPSLIPGNPVSVVCNGCSEHEIHAVFNKHHDKCTIDPNTRKVDCKVQSNCTTGRAPKIESNFDFNCHVTPCDCCDDESARIECCKKCIDASCGSSAVGSDLRAVCVGCDDPRFHPYFGENQIRTKNPLAQPLNGQCKATTQIDAAGKCQWSAPKPAVIPKPQRLVSVESKPPPPNWSMSWLIVPVTLVCAVGLVLVRVVKLRRSNGYVRPSGIVEEENDESPPLLQ